MSPEKINSLKKMNDPGKKGFDFEIKGFLSLVNLLETTRGYVLSQIKYSNSWRWAIEVICGGVEQLGLIMRRIFGANVQGRGSFSVCFGPTVGPVSGPFCLF